MWEMERGRQAGPGEAEDMREKKSSADSTGHGGLKQSTHYSTGRR